MREKILVAALTMLAAVMAGCTGNFEVQQTEPFRVQIDGESQETQLSAEGDGAEKGEFKIDSEDDVDQVRVIVEVTKVEGDDGEDDDTTPTGTTEANETEDDLDVVIVLVIVEDRDTNERLAEQEVEAGDDGAQVALDVDIRGRNNVVIVTQAVQGTADVNVAAETGAGGATTTTSPTTGEPTPTT